MNIREAKTKDIPEILNILYEMEKPKPQNNLEYNIFKKMIQKYIDNKDKKIIVALKDHQIVGCVCFITIYKVNRIKSELYITELVVTKNLRRQGIGKRLIEECKEIARKKCFRIRLESRYKRKSAHKFYKNLGFDQTALTYTMYF